MVAYSPAGDTLAVGVEDGSIFLYAVPDEYELIGKCVRHTSPIISLDFSLVSGCDLTSLTHRMTHPMTQLLIHSTINTLTRSLMTPSQQDGEWLRTNSTAMDVFFWSTDDASVRRCHNHNTPYDTLYNTPSHTLHDTPYDTLYNTPSHTLHDTPCPAGTNQYAIHARRGMGHHDVPIHLAHPRIALFPLHDRYRHHRGGPPPCQRSEFLRRRDGVWVCTCA